MRANLFFINILIWLPFICLGHIQTEMLTELIESSLPQSHVGVTIIDANSGDEIYSHHAEQFFQPASNTKLFTAASSLLELKRDYVYTTEFFLDASKLKNGILAGSLYMVTQGDPSLTSEEFADFFKALHSKGISFIEGNLVLVNGNMINERPNPYFNVGDSIWYYAAPAQSINLDENKISFKLDTSSRKILKIEPIKATPFKVRSHVRLVKAEEAKICTLQVESVGWDINFSGCWSNEDKTNILNFAVPTPSEYVKYQISQNLKKHNISLRGKVVQGKNPLTTSFYVHHSKPLYELIKPLLGDSNNLYADALTKTLGHEIYGYGDIHAGSQAIWSILEDNQMIAGNGEKIEDGAGASHANLVSPNLITQLLFKIYHSPALKEDIKNALPISGERGSLKNRMKGENLKGKVFAKTGTHSDVSTLSGFIDTPSGTKIFSILINANVVDEKARKLQEDILAVVVEW